MAHYYADTSVLVKNYVGESGSAWARQWISSKSNVVYISDSAIPDSHISLTFVAGDRVLLAAARAEGLSTANPFDYAHMDQGEAIP
jgi:hypothetical protein